MNPDDSHHPFASFAEGRREARRNFLLHAAEGGMYMGGMSLLAAESVAPAMVAALGGADVWVALMPTLMMIGISWPSLIAAHRVERLPRVMPFVRVTGILQRLPYLLGALVLWFGGEAYPGPVLAVVVAIPFLSGTSCGFSFPAWVELVSKTVSRRRRSSLWALRNIIGGLLGLAAGGVVGLVLTHAPGPRGFAILHGILFCFLMLSYVLFLLIREPFHEHRLRAPRRSLRDNLAGVPSMLRTDANLRAFTLMRVFATGIWILLPFLALHALEQTGKPESFLGALVTAQMAGLITGNLLAGFWGDRCGGSAPSLAGRFLLAVCCILALVSTAPLGFLAAFVCQGMGSGLIMVGAMSLSIDICPPDRRPTYIAFLTTLLMPSMLGMAGISALLRNLGGGFTWNALAALGCVILSAVFNARIRHVPELED